MKEAVTIPGYPVYTRVYIYITVLVIWYYCIIMITMRLLFIWIINLLLPLSLLSPLKSSLHRYHLYYRYRETRGAYAFGAIVILKMIRHAGQINKHAYAIYTYTIAIVACATIRRGWHDNDDSERDWSRSRLSLNCRSDSFYECEESNKRECEREKWIKGLPFRIHELSRTIHLSDNSLDLCLV